LKILFITCSSNPKRCGITDYVNLLSKELEKNGHMVEIETIDSVKDFAHISKNLPSSDLYSLQFAPYAFSQSGLSGKGLITFAKSLTNKNTHINFHEIWIGAYPKATWKEKTIGWLQKREIINFINICKPSAITCSNSAALDRMRQTGIDASYLYLFGNIPYSPSKKDDSLNRLNIVFFGTLYEKFPYDQLVKVLFHISQSLKKQIHITILGRQRESEGLECMKKVSQKHGFPITLSGELSISKISEELQISDLGISTTPYDIIGKSGTTAAMLEHGLPVLTFDDGDTPKNKLFVMQEYQDQVFLLNDSSVTQKLFSFLKKPRKTFFDGVAYTTKKMLEVIH
jgi:glycosyltransferase involved in cell wall biosynthesis